MTLYPQVRRTAIMDAKPNEDLRVRLCDLANINLATYIEWCDAYALTHRNERPNAGHAAIVLMPDDQFHDLVKWHENNLTSSEENRKSHLNNAIAEMDFFDAYELFGLWRSDPH